MNYVLLIVGIGILVMGWEIAKIVIDLKIQTKTIHDHVLDIFGDLPQMRREIAALRDAAPKAEEHAHSCVELANSLNKVFSDNYTGHNNDGVARMVVDVPFVHLDKIIPSPVEHELVAIKLVDFVTLVQKSIRVDTGNSSEMEMQDESISGKSQLPEN